MGRLDHDLLIRYSWGDGGALAGPEGLLVNRVLEVSSARKEEESIAHPAVAGTRKCVAYSVTSLYGQQ